MANTISDKLDLLLLSKEERKKAEEKFLASISLASFDELVEINTYLKSQGVVITKARELKVFGNGKDEIAKKFSILSELHETDIYKQNPNMINNNVIDIYKRIQYCKQIGKPYKKEDGTYEDFLFSSALWQQTIGREEDSTISLSDEVAQVEDFVTLEPSEVNVTNSSDDSMQDVNEYINVDRDLQDIEAKTTNFQKVRKELEDQLKAIDDLKNGLDFSTDSFSDEISFNDLEPESYGMGRAA